MSRLAALLAAASTACAADLREDFPFDGELPGGTYLVHEARGDQTLTRLDASRDTAWVYLDLDTGEQVPAAMAAGDGEWDLAFQRFRIISNGGVSGVGQTTVAALVGTELEAVSQAPRDGYWADQPDGPDANEDVDSAFLVNEGWYRYDLLAHKLSPRDNVYVVRTGRGAYFKLRLLSYYDQAGSAARLSLLWAQLSPPAG